MAWIFNTKPVTTVRIQESGTANMFSINGCTNAATTPDNAASQINKLLNIGGKSAIVSHKMERKYSEEVIES